MTLTHPLPKMFVGEIVGKKCSASDADSGDADLLRSVEQARRKGKNDLNPMGQNFGIITILNIS